MPDEDISKTFLPDHIIIINCLEEVKEDLWSDA